MLRTHAEHLDVDRVAETFDAVPTTVIELGLVMRRPVDYGVRDPFRLWDRLDDGAYVEAVGRKSDWMIGGPTLPTATFRQFVRGLLLENRLIRGELRLNGRRVDLDRVDMPVLPALGTEDEFVPREASVPFLDGVASEDTAAIEFPVGHVGLCVAPEAHEEGWPKVREWLAERR